MVVDLFDANHLTGKDLAQIDLAGFDADASADGDDDASVMERIVEVRQP